MVDRQLEELEIPEGVRRETPRSDAVVEQQENDKRITGISSTMFSNVSKHIVYKTNVSVPTLILEHYQIKKSNASTFELVSLDTFTFVTCFKSVSKLLTRITKYVSKYTCH